MTEEEVPKKAKSYRTALYIFNFVLVGIGLTCLTMSIQMMQLSSETFFPDWMFQALLSIAVVVLFVGLLGVCGASMSFVLIKKGKRFNLWLMLLALVMSVVIVVEVVMGVMTVLSFEVVASSTPDAATTQSEGMSAQFEANLREQLRTETGLWWEWQKQRDCCGYDNNTIPSPLATGKYCTTEVMTSASPCKEQFWADIGNNILPFAIFCLVMFVIQLMVCWSSLCLGCCISNKKD